MGLGKSFLSFRVDLSRPHFRSEKVTVHSAALCHDPEPSNLAAGFLSLAFLCPWPLGAEPSLSVNPRRLEP